MNASPSSVFYQGRMLFIQPFSGMMIVFTTTRYAMHWMILSKHNEWVFRGDIVGMSSLKITSTVLLVCNQTEQVQVSLLKRIIFPKWKQSPRQNHWLHTEMWIPDEEVHASQGGCCLIWGKGSSQVQNYVCKWIPIFIVRFYCFRCQCAFAYTHWFGLLLFSNHCLDLMQEVVQSGWNRDVILQFSKIGCCYTTMSWGHTSVWRNWATCN